MKVNSAGYIFFAARAARVVGEHPGIMVMTPQFKPLGIREVPEPRVTNCAWGDADRKTLYITAHSGLYRIRTKIVGIRP
jgi:gluconolactonase